MGAEQGPRSGLWERRVAEGTRRDQKGHSETIGKVGRQEVGAGQHRVPSKEQRRETGPKVWRPLKALMERSPDFAGLKGVCCWSFTL